MALSLDQFVSAWNGKYADYDGWYGAQCVDILNFYQRDVIGGKFITAEGAKDWFEHYDTNGAAEMYTKVANDMGDPNQLPARGDVIIWGSRLAGSGGYGHIGIVLSADKKGFTSFDQNYPGGSNCHQQYHVWDSTVLGWLHPRANDAPVPTPPAPATALWVRVFGDYRTLYKNPGSGAFQRICPNQFPQLGSHLDYKVLERNGDFVKIKTQMYGDAWIYVGASVANLTQFFNA